METKDVYVELAKRLNYPNPNSEHLLRIMRKQLTPQEVQILLQLPAEPAALARESGLPEEKIPRILEECTEKGLVIPTSTATDDICLRATRL